MPKTGKNRLHFDLAPPVDGDQQAELDRLVSLGATRIDIGQGEVSDLHLAPVLLGDGIRLFDKPGGRPIRLQQPDAEDPIAAVHVRYRPVGAG